MKIEKLKQYKNLIDKQEGRMYPCSNQTVLCGIFTNDKNKAIDFMCDKSVYKKLKEKIQSIGILKMVRDGCGKIGMIQIEVVDFTKLPLIVL